MDLCDNVCAVMWSDAMWLCGDTVDEVMCELGRCGVMLCGCEYVVSGIMWMGKNLLNIVWCYVKVCCMWL